jgi:hypothetical protein
VAVDGVLAAYEALGDLAVPESSAMSPSTSRSRGVSSGRRGVAPVPSAARRAAVRAVTWPESVTPSEKLAEPVALHP